MIPDRSLHRSGSINFQMKFLPTVYKYIFATLLFLPLIIGCAEKTVVRNETFISFTSETDEVASRAPFIDLSSDIVNFTVWGNYDGTPVFTAQEVVRVDQLWEYTPLQRWILSADQYDFSAYTPVGAGVPNVIGNRLASIDVDCNATQQDLVMAYTIVPKAEIGRTVLMTFRHPLSAIKFSLALNGNFDYRQTYKIISVRWDNVYTEGTFTLNNDNTISTNHTGSAKETVPITEFSGSTLSTTSKVESDFLFVIPQTSKDAVLRLLLEINGERKEIVKVVPIEWESGRKYTYNISIDPFEITIETTPWEVPETEDIIIR